MTTAQHIIERARRHGVSLAVDDGRIKARSPKKPPADLLADLRRNRETIATALAPACRLCRLHDVDERSAMVEMEAGVAAAWAAAYASMQAAQPPAGYKQMRWDEVLNDAGRVIDRWANRAAALGWQPSDVFGTSSGGRHRGTGLAILIHGGVVLAITHSTATIQGVGQHPHVLRRHHDSVWSSTRAD